MAVFLLALSGCAESIPDVDGIETELTADNFAAEVLQEDELVLVDFWAPWCGPCRQMEPAVAYLSVQYEGRVKVGKLNTEDHQQLAQDYGISGIPAFLIFRDGEVIASRTGTSSYRSLSGWVDDQLGQ